MDSTLIKLESQILNSSTSFAFRSGLGMVLSAELISAKAGRMSSSRLVFVEALDTEAFVTDIRKWA